MILATRREGAGAASSTIRRVSGAGLVASIPSPGARDISFGPFEIRFYALCLLAGVVAAVWVAMRRWRARGGNPDLVLEVALWSVLAGLIGARLYHAVTSSEEIGDEWYAPIAIWEGGLGIWGGVFLGVLAGAVIVRLRGESVTAMMDAAAPGILIAQGIGRLGNWFNQELFGGPTGLPWGLEIEPENRPDGYEDDPTFHPTFLYEMLWNFAGAALIIWLGRRLRVRPPGVFCLYVAVYCAGRLIWEQLRVDPSREYLGQRLNFYVSLGLLLVAVAAFVWTQRREAAPERAAAATPATAPAARLPRRGTPGGSRPARAGSSSAGRRRSRGGRRS
jgi:prolipoprotein diacylglyceryl transferase